MAKVFLGGFVGAFKKRNTWYSKLDDFIIFHQDKQYLVNIIPQISEYLGVNLKLTLNPNKLLTKTFSSGVDFLGWVHFSDHRILRTATKKRMFKRLKQKCTTETTHSYLGLLRHGNAYKIRKNLLDLSLT